MSNSKIKCPFCDRVFSKYGLYPHIWRAHGDGKGKPGYPAWNKGLTKETDNRIAKYAATYSSRVALGEIVPWQQGLSAKTDIRIKKRSEKISETVFKKIQNGEWHNSFAKSRKIIYNNISFMGHWEVNFAKWLDNNNIDWDRPLDKFQYYYNQYRNYTPDFYIVGIDSFVEIKGWATDRDAAKWRTFPKKLIVLCGHNLRNLFQIDDFRKCWCHLKLFNDIDNIIKPSKFISIKELLSLKE